jgi:tetratricopeptide (TPR) repeat protein
MDKERIQRLERIIVDNPSDTFTLFALAKEYEKAGDLGKAIQLFEKLLVTDEKYVGAYYHLGKVYEQTGDFTKALNIYSTGIKIAGQEKAMHALSELKNAKMNLEIGE